MNLEIEKTAGGSPTLYGADIDEHYHSVKGAPDESMHVYVKPDWEKEAKRNVRRSLQEVEVIPERLDGPEEGKREVLRAEKPEEIDPRKRMLLIVDPQIDFITGSLPVPRAEEAMNALARYIHDYGHLYGNIFITCDRHPLNHSSFKEKGGKWPMHCVESSVGAAVWPAIMKELVSLRHNVLFLYKGEDSHRDEYSIFRAEKGSDSMDIFLRDDQISHLDICGLAGDVCVSTTLDDALWRYPRIRYRLLDRFTASLDGGDTVRQWCRDLARRNRRMDEEEQNKQE